ncbi:hypothetical protein [Novosphingobium sp. 9]|uniref:hypothetical protein n=1 Tax=Novosphingobium sp. 9 TaxID=2025349 RepID=UPI0021B4F8D9|nr:hypothetical protein [Novosphingobium sp. 9]
MSVHPILLRAVLTAVVAEITNEQREALYSPDDGIRFEAEDDLVGDIMVAMASLDGTIRDACASLGSHQRKDHR